MTEFNRLHDKSQHFLASFDKNKDQKVTRDELAAGVDQDSDGLISDAELADFAKAAGQHKLSRDEIRVLNGALASAEAELPLFEGESFQATAQLQQEVRAKRTVLPVRIGRAALDSRQLSDVSQVKKGQYVIQDQGPHNSCGTTTLSMMMKYFQGHQLENSVTQIDKYIRAIGQIDYMLPSGDVKTKDLNEGTASLHLVDYARKHGMRAELKNQASMKDLKHMLDQGVPCMCYTDWEFRSSDSTQASLADPKGESFHWVSVVGYETQNNPATGKDETVFLIGNPHGYVQRVHEKDFDKIWAGPHQSGHLMPIGGDKLYKTHVQRLFISMVPADDDAQVVAPDGKIRQAGDITLPSGNADGLTRLTLWGEQLGTRLGKTVSNAQEAIAQGGGELLYETEKGYAENGVLGALSNLFTGDKSEIPTLKKMAKNGTIETKAQIINSLMNRQLTRGFHEDLIYDILFETSWSEFSDVMKLVDARQLAQELEDDNQAGRVMAWIARAEIEASGSTGSKFDAFASYLAEKHREQAILTFVDNEHMQKKDRFHQVSTGALRHMIEHLMSGATDKSEEKAIYQILNKSSWRQFTRLTSRLDMERLASELERDQQLAPVLKWTIQGAADHQGSWNKLSEMLDFLERKREYLRADNLVGDAIMANNLTRSQLKKIPTHLRKRLINLVDDYTRVRSDNAVAAQKLLSGL